jgi:hypothetical protein
MMPLQVQAKDPTKVKRSFVFEVTNPPLHRTPEIGFRAVLTEGAPWQVEVSRA